MVRRAGRSVNYSLQSDEEEDDVDDYRQDEEEVDDDDDDDYYGAPPKKRAKSASPKKKAKAGKKKVRKFRHDKQAGGCTKTELSRAPPRPSRRARGQEGSPARHLDRMPCLSQGPELVS